MDRETFLASHLVQDAVLKQIEVIGEAAKHLSPDVTEACPDVPWKDIAGMRDFIVHNFLAWMLKRYTKPLSKTFPCRKTRLQQSCRTIKSHNRVLEDVLLNEKPAARKKRRSAGVRLRTFLLLSRRS